MDDRVLILRAHAAQIRLQIRTASPTDQRLDAYQVEALALAKELEEAALILNPSPSSGESQ